MEDRPVGANELVDALVRRDAEARAAQRAAEREEKRRTRMRNLRKQYGREMRENLRDKGDKASGAMGMFRRAVLAEQERSCGGDPCKLPSINYLQRYNALLGMQDRARMLERLEQTVLLAGRIIDGSALFNPGESCRRFALGVRADLQELAALKVAPATEDGKKAPSPPREKAGESVLAFLETVLDAAFSSSAGKFAEPSAWEVADGEFEVLFRQVRREMREAFANFEALEAQAVAGTGLRPEELSPYKGSVTCELRYSVEALRRLYDEVLHSLQTFKQVVSDNGLFAAFLNESSYGQCSGFSWYCESDYGDKPVIHYYGKYGKTNSGIPNPVEEEPGGDTPERAIERMRKFNAVPYFGMLDDDFTVHVEGFWYGFRKLMEFTNSMYVVDDRAFRRYLKRIEKQLRDQATELGMRMDEAQLVNWYKQAKALTKDYERRHRRAS